MDRIMVHGTRPFEDRRHILLWVVVDLRPRDWHPLTVEFYVVINLLEPTQTFVPCS